MRPPELVHAYLELVQRDVAAYGLLDAAAGPRRCPACGGDGAEAFRRLGFAYRRCERCASLFVSPAPDPARLERYQCESAAEGFWRDNLLTATASVRSRYALGPRAHWVLGTAAARCGRDLDVYVLGARAGVIAETVGVSPVVRRCVPVTSTEMAGAADVVVAFDVF